MRKLRSEKEIIQNWQGNPSKPLVSILCTAFNHEKFIDDALEGFLIQETNFPFEILIHDDASIDSTADIIREYERQYPQLIKPIYQKDNQYSKGIKPDVQFNYPRAKGEYIALCEGDDYWTDPRKLQIQVNFLLNNPGYVVSGHDAIVVDEDGNQIKDSKIWSELKKDFDREGVIKLDAAILTMSMVFRNVLKEFPIESRMMKNGDRFLTSMLGKYGKSKYHDDISPAVYRMHANGIWSMISEKEQINDHINSWFWLYRYYNRIGEDRYALHFWNKFIETVFLNIKSVFLIKTLFIRAKSNVFMKIKNNLKHILITLGLKSK